MMMRKTFRCLLVGLGWVSLASGQSLPLPWSWEFAAGRVPAFEEKRKENKQWLVVEVLFRNNQTTDQKLVVAKENFQATSQNGKPIEILGLLFRMQNFEGAKRMRYVGGMKHMETLSEGQGESAIWFYHSPGPVEVVVEGGKSYKQRVLVARPKGKKPFRLKFGNLPDLEIPLPK